MTHKATIVAMASILLVCIYLAIDEVKRNAPPTTYWPSIEEMQEFAGAKVDGVWGRETDWLYRTAREKWYCDNAYMELIEKQK